MFGQLRADTDPGVKPTWDALPPGVKTFLVDVVGTLMNIGILAGVAVLIAGLTVWGIGALSNRPGVGSVGVKIAFVSVGVAIGSAGANALIGFFAGQGATIFS
ncbi:hypothetical protein ACTXJ1_16920 [Brachybacterium alimentarium]|uniref:hypothetical protein n=1 Tax=Brachybacterium alimentarium TaxID=47845 RepID=UPI003FD0A240